MFMIFNLPLSIHSMSLNSIMLLNRLQLMLLTTVVVFSFAVKPICITFGVNKASSAKNYKSENC